MSCFVCKNQVYIDRDIKTNISYNFCANCLFISKNYSPTDEISLKTYNNHNNSLSDLKYVKYFDDYLNYSLISNIDKSSRGLDFGSGPSPVLSQIFKRDYGISVDIYDLFYSKEEVYINKKYDFITSTEVIEHIKNPKVIFEFANKYLKTGGILSLMTLFAPKNQDEFYRWWYIRDLTHISFFSFETFKYLAKMYNYQIINCDQKRIITLKKLS